jgi:Ca2+-transporting ATPase
MQPYLLDLKTTFHSVSSGENGLSGEEAQKRLCDNGPNKLAEGKKTPLIVRFFEQMKDPMILILLAAALVSGIRGD